MFHSNIEVMVGWKSVDFDCRGWATSGPSSNESSRLLKKKKQSFVGTGIWEEMFHLALKHFRCILEALPFTYTLVSTALQTDE